MSASGETCGNSPLVVLEGEIDHASMPDFARAVESASRGDSFHNFLLDLSEVSYIDSGGLSVIYSTMREIADGGVLGLIGAQPNVLRILQVGGIAGQDVVRLFETREQACQALAAPGVDEKGR